MAADPIPDRGREPAPASGWREVVLVGWALLLATLLLGPALGRGYVLSYDMVWVPDLALRSDFLGVASGLPRAVPSDAVVSVLDEVVPGMLLQKLVLLGALVGAGLGWALLAPDRSLAARLAVVSLGMWNPLVVERLVLGQWPVVLCAAVAPWVVGAARTWRVEGRFPRRLLWLVPLGSLSASTGVATGLLLLALVVGRRRAAPSVLLVAAANAPWVLSGLLHVATATSDALGARVFALHAEGSVPGPLAALTLGGVWNAEVVPDSRTGTTGWVALVVVLALAVLGARLGGWAADRREAHAVVVLWVVGWGLAVLSSVAPGATGVLAAHVPGGGLVRDGSRLLLLCLPLVVMLVGRGTACVVQLTSRPGAAPVVATVVTLLPVALLPDAAWGASGRLHAVDYPTSYARARSVVAAQGSGGDVLLLPASSYRQPAWNRGVKVLDPTGRYLTPDYVASDELSVSGVVLAGEDPRAADAVRALSAPSPEARAEALAGLGIGFVVVDRRAPGTSPEVAGEALLETADLDVVRVAAPVPTEVPRSWLAVMTLAWTAYVGLLAAGLVAALLAATRGAARHRRPRWW